MSGQSIQDRIMAAKHSIAGQGLAKAVCKASTEEIMGPKKKHLDYLVQCTHEPNVSIPSLANLLIERTQHTNWVVVFKALVTTHHLMNYGNERFSQYLASNNCTVNLGTFLDKTGIQGYDMSTYIRRYGKYINGKAVSYRSMAYDFCKIKRGREDGLLRTMNLENLLKALPVLQDQLDSLLEFDAAANNLTNGVINAAFMLLFKDLIRLFACYNDGIINLLEKFFDMPKKQCKDALEIYKKFLARMERCAEVLKTAEMVGIDKGEIPDLTKAPSSLLEALEEHVKSLDGQKTKKSDKTQPVIAAAISEMQSPTSPVSSSAGYLSEQEKQKIIAEEERQLEQLKEQKSKSQSAHTSPAVEAKPFAEPVMQPNVSISTTQDEKTSRPSDDLLSLDGPDLFPSNVSAAMKTAPAGAVTGPPAGAAPAVPMSNNPFVAAVPPSWNMPTTGPATFSDVLQPMVQSKPAHTQQPSPQAAPPKLIAGDLDSSLASLAGNLNILDTSPSRTAPNWGKPVQEVKLTGGNNWQGIQYAQATVSPVHSQSIGAVPVMGMPMGMQHSMQGQNQNPPPPQDPFGAL